MALKMALRWKNPDASSDINLRYKDVFNKGFVSGGDINPSGISLQVDVTPFVLVNFDGAVVVSDATETLNVTDGQINYVVCRARYRLLDSPILQMQVLTEAAYLADPELDWLHVVAVVDLSVGGPYAFVPANRVFYENRDEIDKQGRATWREPVASFGTLPTDRNRDGDVRLTLDTGSLYWWKEATSTWEIFDEVPLQNHRDREHVNGITGDSSATTLEPDVAGTDMTIAAVPAGSGYTVDGRYVTAPAGLTTISAASVGAVRGLIQVAFDLNGNSTENFRVQKSADVLDISAARIVNISDGHPLGTFTLLFSTGPNQLTWAGGPPVSVTTGNTYRLYASDMLNWIDVSLVGALPGIAASDNYDVNASLSTDSTFLVGYWFWDGAAILQLGADKRTFGNLGYENLSDDLKNQYLHPRWDDLRGSMVYSGGDVTDLGGLSARISGPIIAYINGVRYEVAGNYTGAALSPSTTNYIYINSAGALTIGTTAPTGDVATIAQVVTGVGTISSITDTRDPQLILGNATREAKIQFGSGGRNLSWNVDSPSPGQDLIALEKGGSQAGVRLDIGRLKIGTGITAPAADGDVRASGVIWSDGGYVGTAGYLRADQEVQSEIAEWSDGGSGDDHHFVGASQAQDIYIARGSEQDIGAFQIGEASPSLLGSLRAAEAARKYGYGIISGLTLTKNSDIEVQLEPGSFIDGYGRLITVASAVVFPVTIDFGWQIYWAPDLNNFVCQTDNNTLNRQDLPFYWLNRAGGVIDTANFRDVRWIANGNRDRQRPHVGSQTGLTFANFSNLEAALLHATMNNSGEGHSGPHDFIITQSSVPLAPSGAGISATDPWWPNNPLSSLNNINIIGRHRQSAHPALTWTTAEAGFNFTGAVPEAWNVSNIRFFYNGAGNAADPAVCFMQNAGASFGFDNVIFDGGDDLSGAFYWDSTAFIGGGPGDVSSPPMIFNRCVFSNAFDAGVTNPVYFLFDSGAVSSAGTLVFRDCLFGSSSAAYQNIFVCPSCPELYTYHENCVYTNNKSGAALLEDNISSDLSLRHVFNNCQIIVSASTSLTTSTLLSFGSKVAMYGCTVSGPSTASFVFDSQGGLTSGCRGHDGIGIVGFFQENFVGCDFFSGSTFSGIFEYAVNTRFAVAPGVPIGQSGLFTDARVAALNCHFIGSGTQNALILGESADNEWSFTNCEFYFSDNNTGDSAAWIVPQGTGASTFTLVNCRFPEDTTFGRYSRNGALIAPTGAADCAVIGCWMDTGHDAEAFFYADTGTPSGDFLLIGNHINTGATLLGNGLIYVNSTSGSTCSIIMLGNVIRSSGSRIITLGAEDVNMMVGNYIRQIGTANTQAIFTSADCDAVILAANYIEVNTDPGATGVLELNGTDVVLVGNVIRYANGSGTPNYIVIMNSFGPVGSASLAVGNMVTAVTPGNIVISAIEVDGDDGVLVGNLTSPASSLSATAGVTGGANANHTR